MPKTVLGQTADFVFGKNMLWYKMPKIVFLSQKEPFEVKNSLHKIKMCKKM
jgi:hypothetical protein